MIEREEVRSEKYKLILLLMFWTGGWIILCLAILLLSSR